MGAFPRRRTTHYWNGINSPNADTCIPGLADPVVHETMLCGRYHDLMAALSFMDVGDDAYKGDPLRKLRWVNDELMKRTKLAWEVEPHFAIDESRVKLHSKFCPFTWTMLCKPIKVGCTIYNLVFESGFCYSWRYWSGKGAKTKGQPTDKKAVDEDDSKTTGWVTSMIDSLIDSKFDGTGATAFFDKAFTSLRLARRLWARGIYMVGMMRALRPKKQKSDWTKYWPFRTYEREDEGAHPPGFERRAYTPLEPPSEPQGQDFDSGGALCATVWRDRRFVTFVGTTYLDLAREQVLCWTKSVGKRILRTCSVLLKLYTKQMGPIDHMDREVSYSNIRMNQYVPCAARAASPGPLPSRSRRLPCSCHAAALVWITCHAQLQEEIPPAALPRPPLQSGLQQRACRLQGHVRRRGGPPQEVRPRGVLDVVSGAAREALIKRGNDRGSAERGTASARKAGNLTSPSWAPKKRKLSYPSTDRRRVAPAVPEVHHRHHINNIKVWDSNRNKKIMARGRCVVCLAAARRARSGDYLPNGSRIPHRSCGCNLCKVNLCEGCFDKWDHGRRQVPEEAVCLSVVA